MANTPGRGGGPFLPAWPLVPVERQNLPVDLNAKE